MCCGNENTVRGVLFCQAASVGRGFHTVITVNLSVADPTKFRAGNPENTQDADGLNFSIFDLLIYRLPAESRDSAQLSDQKISLRHMLLVITTLCHWHPCHAGPSPATLKLNSAFSRSTRRSCSDVLPSTPGSRFAFPRAKV